MECKGTLDCTYQGLNYIVANSALQLTGNMLMGSREHQSKVYIPFFTAVVAKVCALIPYYLSDEIQKEHAHPFNDITYSLPVGILGGYVDKIISSKFTHVLDGAKQVFISFFASQIIKSITSAFSSIENKADNSDFWCPSNQTISKCNETFINFSSNSSGAGEIMGILTGVYFPTLVEVPFMGLGLFLTDYLGQCYCDQDLEKAGLYIGPYTLLSTLLIAIKELIARTDSPFGCGFLKFTSPRIYDTMFLGLLMNSISKIIHFIFRIKMNPVNFKNENIMKLLAMSSIFYISGRITSMGYSRTECENSLW